MFERLEGHWRLLAAIFLFPLTFQDPVVAFAWGGEDDFWLALIKRLFLLLPALAMVFACWATIAGMMTIIVRSKRRQFMSALFVTWWDLGRAIFAFWGGVIRFCFQLAGWIGGLLRLFGFGLLLTIKDLILMPVRLVGELSQGSFKPGVPWPAIMMMIGWTLLEALIFTFVMTPLVTDVLSGLAGTELRGLSLQLPLYLTFTVFVMGSYAVLHSFGEALKDKNIIKIINYGLVEVVVALVEVVFLYREFVDALVPWFAQHAGEGFELGIAGTLGIACFAWLGIRAMTWFLFGASAVPMLMAMIQRTGIEHGERKGFIEALRSRSEGSKPLFVFVHEAMDKIKGDIDWVHTRGDELLSAFVLPPLQILAACINFCTLCISSNHLFDLPFKSYRDLLEARMLLLNAKKAVADDN